MARAPRLRDRLEFAEADLVVPRGGPKPGKFRRSRQPVSGLLLQHLDTGRYNRLAAVGPTQASKTWSCFAMPTLHHLFEICEDVIVGIPTMEMSGDKWRRDLEPAIKAGPFAHLLPREGAGSRGGKVEMIQFRHGPTLKFMSGGGGDEKRSGYTSRVVAFTELDKLDEAGGASAETDKISQIIARTSAFENPMIYMECTPSTSKGRIWREYVEGTESRIIIQCVHCSGWVTPEREHLTGWKGAASAIEAGELARLVCPACGVAWTEEDRIAANSVMRLVHRGQEVTPEGEITGPHPPTKTLGFRWTCVNNLFVSMRRVAELEWSAAREPDEELAERKMKQYYWAKPHDPPGLDLAKLSYIDVMSRTEDRARGVVPDDTLFVTVGSDWGRHLGWMVAVAFSAEANPRIIDYTAIEVPSKSLGDEPALLMALHGFVDRCNKGWTRKNGSVIVPRMSIADSGYLWRPVYLATQAGGERFLPCKGFGATQYRKPAEITDTIGFIGDAYHVALQNPDSWAGDPVWLAEINVDKWKGYARSRITTPLHQPGAMSLFAPNERYEHQSIAKHLTAERPEQRGNHEIFVLPNENMPNHYGDAFVYALVAGHMCGARIIQDPPKQPEPAEVHHPLITSPDGRAYLASER